MSMQKGKHQGGQQSQGYSQSQPRFQSQQPHAAYIRTTPQRPEVNFHVAPSGFPGPQQGGGPNGPPGGPQGMSRGVHHPGHHGGPTGPGNPSLPPQGSSSGPGQLGGQVQQQSQNQGPQGPTPTSTPPGQDMGKQPPQHLQQGQQVVSQHLPPDFAFLQFPPPNLRPEPAVWDQTNVNSSTIQVYNVGVPNQSRPTGSQPFYQNQRGPTPRMAGHRGPMVNMPSNHVGQQMFSHPVQMQSMPQMYASQVVPAQLQQQMFVPQGHMPMFPNQPRHQNHTNAAYYTQPGHQQILMAQHPLYATPGYPQQHAPAQPFYYQTASPVGMQRPGAGGPGGPGPQMTQPQPQQVVQGGPPTQQMGQPPVPMAMVSGGPPVVVGSQPSGPQGPPSVSRASSGLRRRFALDIVDPKTMKSINNEIYVEGSSLPGSPPGSQDSSARQTPQPESVVDANATSDVAKDFAARVAKVANEGSAPPAPQQFSEVSTPSPTNEQIAGSPPEPVVSIQDQTEFDSSSSSKPIVSVDDNQWKTAQQRKPSLKSDIVKDSEPVSKVDNIENNNVKPVSVMECSYKEFVPHSTVSYKDVTIPKLAEVTKETVMDQPIQVIINKEPQTLLENNITPVVSANANTPSITLVHKTKTENFPSLKLNSQVNQSPRRKQTHKEPSPVETKSTRDTVSVEKSVTSSVQIVPSVAVSTTQSAETKLQKKEEFVVPQVPAPKDRRDPKKDKSSRGRREKASVSRERADKSRSSTERKLSQSREREAGSRKNSSQSRERESEKPREKTPQPSRETAKVVPKKDPEPVVPALPIPASEPVVLKPVLQAPVPIAQPIPPVVVEETKQANGDVNLEVSDGKAPKPHQQNAKSAKRGKMRTEPVRKEVAEIEVAATNTVEDVTVSTPPTESVVVPEMPVPVPVLATFVPAPVPAPEPTPEPAPEPTPVLIPVAAPIIARAVSPVAAPAAVTEEIIAVAQEEEVVDTETFEKEESDKMVLARNEENSKVSAAALKEDVPDVIENVLEDTKVPPPLHKQLSYKADQWSPNNQEGKKKYDRDFLMELKEDPQSKKKPENLPDMDVVLKDNSNRQQSRGMTDQRPMVNRGQSENHFTPGFMRSGGVSTSRGPPPKRNSQQGKPVSKSGKPNVIHMSLSLREDVKLHETENAWKPSVMKRDVTQAEAQVEELNKSVRGVLNKLTPQKFDTLVSQVQALPIDSSEKLQGVINLVFEKAVDEPGFSVAYAQMCKVLSGMQVPAERKTPDDPEYVNFRKLIVNRCQAEFEKNTEAELNKDAKLKEINLQTDVEKKKELMLVFEEEERKIRMKSVGNIRFIGELFKLQMLTTSIMHRCIRHLLTAGDEESLECLCKLLTTIGKDLEMKAPNASDLGQYFTRMREIAVKRGQGSVSSRVRFMLQDVIELRQSNWIPRRDDANPKTMDQIQKEADKETMDMHIALSAPQTPGRRQDDRGGGRDMGDRGRKGGSQRGDSNQQGSDGWTNVPARTNRNIAIDSSKFKVNKMELDSVNLGSTNQFSKWSRGAGSATKSDEKKPTQGYNNPYNVLQETQSGDDKRGSVPPSVLPSSRPGPGKSTPSPSIEKERMLASFKGPSSSESLPSSRGSSIQHSSKPSSRDNSSRRSGMGSQPGSVSASNEDISRTADKPSTVSASKAKHLDFDDIAKKSKLVVDELLSNNLMQDCAETVQETFISSQKHDFVRECINVVLEKSALNRLNVGRLMCHLIQQNIISVEQYVRGLGEVLETSDDIAIDVPKVWLYLAEIIVPIMTSELLSFTELSNAVKPMKAVQLIVELLQLLVKEKGPNWIRERWDKAGIKWNDFLEQGLVEDFIKNHNLEYTVGAVSSSQPTTNLSQMTMDQIREKILTFLNAEQLPSAPTSFDQVCDWINANVGDRVKEPPFIRALMTAICESAIHLQPNTTTWKLNENILHQHQHLLLRYVDNKEDLELECIYAVQSLINQLEHPQGLLCAIFQDLYDNSIFSYDAFIAWEASKDPAEQLGKGVALKSLTSFYTSLKESESSCDES